MKPEKSSANATSTRDCNQVDELLSKTEDAQDRSLRGAEALELEGHEAASRLRRGKAVTRAERGELSITRLEWATVEYQCFSCFGPLHRKAGPRVLNPFAGFAVKDLKQVALNKQILISSASSLYVHPSREAVDQPRCFLRYSLEATGRNPDGRTSH